MRHCFYHTDLGQQNAVFHNVAIQIAIQDGGAKVQVTGHRSGHRLQATGQVTGHKSQVTGQVTGHTKNNRTLDKTVLD